MTGHFAFQCAAVWLIQNGHAFNKADIAEGCHKREKDYEDIESIALVEKELDWRKIVQKAIIMRPKIPWILIDLEEKIRMLRKKVFIKKEILDMIYDEEEKGRKTTQKFREKRAKLYI